MIKNILVSGCSFTSHLLPEKLSWPYHIKKHNIINVGEMASGNDLITRNFIKGFHDNKIDYAIIMWSDPNRIEFLLDKTNIFHEQIYKDLRTEDILKNVILTGEWKSDGILNWYKTGGYFNSNYDINSKNCKNMVDYFYKKIHTYELMMMKTYENILLVQNLCQINNVKYKFMTFRKIFDVGKYKMSVHYEDLINWDNFLFFDDNYGGMQEWCKVNGYYSSDGEHPNVEAHKQFVNDIIQPMIDDE